MKGSSQILCLLERRLGVCGVELSASLVGVGGSCMSSAGISYTNEKAS